jgi:hypothetical protein
MTLFRQMAAVSGIVVLVGCADPVGPRRDPLIRTTESAVEVQNQAGRTIYHAVFAIGHLLFIDWAAVVMPELAIASGGTVSVPYAAILGLSPGNPQVAVYWWYAEDADKSGYVPFDRVHSKIVQAQF